MGRTVYWCNTLVKQHRWGIVKALLLLWMTALTGVIHAQSREFWEKPVEIYETAGVVGTSGFALMADRDGFLHLFFPHAPIEGDVVGLDYMVWDTDKWSSVVNIFVNADGSNVSFPRVVVDEERRIHLTWMGGNNVLYYAHADRESGLDARGWSNPRLIGDGVYESDLLLTRDGKLCAIFINGLTVNMIQQVCSLDRGQTWLYPEIVMVLDEEQGANNIRVVEDEAKRWHLTWTAYVLPDGWPPVGAFYSRSLDQGVTWELPQQIAEARYGQLGVASVGRDEVHLVWRSTVGGRGTFHQWSRDGGETWFAPQREDDGGGFSGMPAFAVDSLSRLHYVIGPVFYAFWNGSELSNYVDVATPQLRALASESPGEGAVLAITKGQVVHVIFQLDGKTLWHAQKVLSVPALPTLPALSTPNAFPTLPQPVFPTPILTTTRVSLTVSDDSVPISGGSSSTFTAAIPLILGGGSSLLIIITIILISRWAKRHGFLN